FSGSAVIVDGKDVMPEIRQVRANIREFSEKIHEGEIRGATGKAFRHAVIIGIGGSYLGTEFVAHALHGVSDKNIELHFLSNVDIHNFG
ncbi:glucose-6-phosphate isomerase, partial [Desulfobacteraceae bacterium SEEP-SAG9]